MAELDLSLSDALSDCVARPGQEALVQRDFVAQLEAEAFDDQIGETVGKTDYIPLLDGDGTATDVGPALENGQKKAEGVQKPGSKVSAVMQPGRPEPHVEVHPWADPPDLGSDLLIPASMVHTAGPLGSPTGPVQVVDLSPMGAFSDLMEVGVAPPPAGRPPSMAEPQQYSPMLPEPQAPRGPLHAAPGASPGDRWPDEAAGTPTDLPFTPSVSTVISRHAAGSLASSPDGRGPRESAAYAGGDEKEGDGSDRSKQKRKKKRRQKDEGSWDHPEPQEAPDDGGPAPGDVLYQRVGPHRDKAAGEGAWEEQIGKSGGRGKKGKSRKKLPEEWAVTAEPFVPAAAAAHVQAETLMELGAAAAPPHPRPEEPYPGLELGWSGPSREFYPDDVGLVPDPLDQDLFSITASSVPQLAQSSGLKATAPPFTMPAAAVLLGSSPLSSGPAHSFLSDAVDGELLDPYSPGSLLMDTSVFSSASQPTPMSARPLHASASASDSSWFAGDSLLSASGDSFDLGDLPASLGCPLPAGVVLDPSGPAPLRSPRTTAQDSHGPPREHPDHASPQKKNRPYSSASSSSSSLKSPTFSAPPQDGPASPPCPQTGSAAAPASPPGSHLNPAAKPFFPGLTEPLEAPDVAPSSAPVIEDTQTPGRYDGGDTTDNKMEEQMERLDEYIQLDQGERKRERAEEEKLKEQHAATDKETQKTTEPAKEETEKEEQVEEKVAGDEEMEDWVEETQDKPQLGDMRAKEVEKVERSADGQTQKTIQVSGSHGDQETLILERSKPGEKAQTVTVTAATDKTETEDAKATKVSQEDCIPEEQQTPILLDLGFDAPEKHLDTSVEESKVDTTKVQESKVDTKVQESKVDTTKVQESKVDTKVQESKVDTTKVQESKVDTTKVQESKVDTKVQESKVDTTKVQESKVDTTKVQESKVDTKVQESKVDTTKVQESKVDTTGVQESKVTVTLMEDPKVEVPLMEEAKVEDPKVEKSKVEVTFAEDPKAEESEAQAPTASIADRVEKSTEEKEEEVTAKQHQKVEPEHQEGDKSVGKAVEIKDKVKEEVNKTVEKKEKTGKLETVTKRPAARPSTGSSALGKEASSPEKKTKPAAAATKLTAATKAAPTRRPAAASTTTTTTSSMSSTLAKKTPAARPASAPAAVPKRAPGLAASRPPSSVPSAGTALRDVKPKTTTTTTTERRVPGSKVTTVPAARSAAGPAPNRNGPTATSRPATVATSRPTSTATRVTAAPRPALSAATRKPPAAKPDGKLGAERKLGPLKTTSAEPSKPRTSSALSASAATGAAVAARPKSAALSSSAGPGAAEKRAPLSRARPATTTSSTSTTSARTATSTSRTSTSTTRTSTSTSRPAARPGSASNPDIKSVRSKTASTDRMKPLPGAKVSSVSQNKGTASKEPSQGKAHIDSVKPDYSHVTSRLGSKDNVKHVPAGGNVQILNKKVDLSKVTSKCGSKDNMKHKPGGGVAKTESHKVNLKDKAPAKVGSVDNLVGPPEKVEEAVEEGEGNTGPPAVSVEQGPPEAPAAAAAQENGLKEGGPCGAEGLCDARIPETSL